MKSLFAGVLAGVLLFTQPALAQAPPATSPVTNAVLANGMHVVIVRNHLAPVVTVSLTYGVGSNDDTIPGIAHATEHMLFRGTDDVTSDQFANMATRMGAQYNALTTNQFTRFYFTVPSAYAPVIYRIEADRMERAAMTASAWATERGAIEQEVKAHQSNPLYDVSRRISTLFYGDTPYAGDAVGTIAGFEKMTAPDIARFYRTWYHPNNATLVIAGDVDPAATLADVHAAFDGETRAELPAHPAIHVAPLPTSTVAQTVDFPLPIVALAFRLPGLQSPDYAASQVLMGALNNGRSTMTDLSVSGKVLGAFATESAYPEVGFGMIVAIARPTDEPKTALQIVTDALAPYVKDGVPPELVEAAKTRLLATQDYDAASIPGQAFAWSASLAQGETSPAGEYDALQHVSVDDVNRVLRAYVTPGHELSLLLGAKPNAVIRRADAAAAQEHVEVTTDKRVALPAWSLAYFGAPLHAPRADDVAKTTRLKNGITVSVRRETISPTVILRGEIHTSPALYEPRGKEGVSSMTDGLLGWGTTTYDFKAYNAALDAIAADVSLGTSFTMKVRANDVDRAMALLADGELHPSFTSQAFDVVHRNNVQALAAMQKLPQAQASIARTDALYGKGDPRRRRATAASADAVGLKDVKNWYAFAYRPDLTTISIVGDVSPDRATELVRKYFGAWKNVGRKPSFKFPSVKSGTAGTSVTVKSAASKQSDVTLTQAIGIQRGSSDVIALELANTVLSGEGTGSLLFRTVREQKGYVYTIDSSVDVERHGGTFSIAFASDAKNVAKAQATAVAEIERMRRDPLPEVDVQQAKALLLARDIVQLDTYSGLANDLLASAESGIDANDMYRYYKLMLRTTPAQIRDAMRKYIDPKRFSRVIVAPSD